MPAANSPPRATPPFTVRSSEAAFWVEDATGLRFGYCYFEDKMVVGTGADRPSRDLARRLAHWIARLPDLAATAPPRNEKSPPAGRRGA